MYPHKYPKHCLGYFIVIHIKSEISTARFFSTGSYDDKTPYDAICTIHHISDDEAYICGLHGTISRETIRELMNKLRDLGISIVRFERHGKDKVITL